MSVSDYCRSEPKTCRAEVSLHEAARKMDEQGVGALVVVDERGHPLGMVTDRDVVMASLRKRLDPERTRVSAVMDGDLVSVTAKAPLAVAIRMMRHNGVRRLPVVDPKSGELRGLITSDDVVQLLAAELGGAADVVRQQFPADLRPSRALDAGGR